VKRQAGAALLTALLMAALVAALGATAYWQQWRAWAVERAERDRTQGRWLLTGALDWARLILREDGRASQVDHLGEPWAVPLQPTQLSTFLAATPDQADQTLEATRLSGRIDDLQGRLNWRNLIDVVGNQPRLSGPDQAAFERLFQQLGLPAVELQAVARGLEQAWTADSARRPVPPGRLEDLHAYGLSPGTLTSLETLTAWLPERTPLNVNTAPAAVLQAILPGVDTATVQGLVDRRSRQHYGNVESFLAALGRPGAGIDANRLSTTSRYFLVTGRIERNGLAIEQQAALARDGVRVKVLWREHRAVPATQSSDRPGLVAGR